jgi:hypothetical protein
MHMAKATEVALLRVGRVSVFFADLVVFLASGEPAFVFFELLSSNEGGIRFGPEGGDAAS